MVVVVMMVMVMMVVMMSAGLRRGGRFGGGGFRRGRLRLRDCGDGRDRSGERQNEGCDELLRHDGFSLIWS
jgi:hypothetical protein